MKKTHLFWLLGWFWLITPPLGAVNLSQYTRSLDIPVDETSRFTLLGIIQSCGNTPSIDDECVLSLLNRTAREKNNVLAKAIANDYRRALNEGNYLNPACQVETHRQANRIIGRCLISMHHYFLQQGDKERAIQQYELCLQGGLQVLVYQGNIVAQYLLSNLFEQKQIPDAVSTWKSAIKLRKDTDEYQLLMKCYSKS